MKNCTVHSHYCPCSIATPWAPFQHELCGRGEPMSRFFSAAGADSDSSSSSSEDDDSDKSEESEEEVEVRSHPALAAAWTASAALRQQAPEP